MVSYDRTNTQASAQFRVGEEENNLLFSPVALPTRRYDTPPLCRRVRVHGGCKKVEQVGSLACSASELFQELW
jgi:hypothetical protein